MQLARPSHRLNRDLELVGLSYELTYPGVPRLAIGDQAFGCCVHTRQLVLVHLRLDRDPYMHDPALRPFGVCPGRLRRRYLAQSLLARGPILRRDKVEEYFDLVFG